MRILCVGDVCQNGGMDFVRRNLKKIREEYKIDFVCLNGENSNEGISNGISPESADELFLCGADVITTGNHAFGVKGISSYLEDTAYILRPSNMPPETPGKGYCLYDTMKAVIAVINLSGTVYMWDKYSNPFEEADRILEELKNKADIIIVDFHAEATAEKKAMGFYLDGRVSAVFGTHTHVQTSDVTILKNGTAYITDVGMTGPIESVLGIDKEIIIARFARGDKSKFEAAKGKCEMNCMIFETDKNHKVISAESFSFKD